MESGAIGRTLPEITHGDHCCLFYSSPQEQARATAEFLALGLGRNERCVFVGEPGSIELVRKEAGLAGIDVEREIAGTRLILSAERDYLDDGHWRTEKMLGFLQKAYDSALSDGFSALRAAGDVAWQVGPDADFREVVNYEALLDVFFVGKRMVGMCQYPKDRCPPDTLAGVLNTHKIAAVDRDVCSNLHYLAPAYYVEKDEATRQKIRADWMTSQLLRAKRAEDARDALRDQLLQAQKMEVVGRFAGGVAHDFNNILTAIVGLSDLVLAGGKLSAEVKRDLEEIKTSGERGVALTRQLLTFSRSRAANPRLLDLNGVVASMRKLLGRILPPNVELETVLSPRPCGLMADAGHIEQVVMNLALNARDAMPCGGRLVLETAEVELGQDVARRPVGLAPGPHVMLAVSDTGQGMDEATKARLFEPFFTTKGPEKGTGLGLSTVLSIVRENMGAVAVASEPGKGATFKVYFPRAEASAADRED